RYREFEVARVDADAGAGERHAFGVTGQLELRGTGAQGFKVEVAIGQNEDQAAIDATVHASGHLQDLVGTEMEAMQHVATTLDNVAVAGVVDDHGVESGHVERRLPGSRHGEQPRL